MVVVQLSVSGSIRKVACVKKYEGGGGGGVLNEPPENSDGQHRQWDCSRPIKYSTYSL